MRVLLSDKMTDEEKLSIWHCINIEIAIRQLVNRKIRHFEIIIPYVKRTAEEYIIDPDLSRNYFRDIGNRKVLTPAEEILTNGNYMFQINVDDYYMQIYGMLPQNILLFSRRISKELSDNLCKTIIKEYEIKWKNNIYVKIDGLYGDIEDSLICKYSDFGYKQLDTTRENTKLKPYEVPIRMKGLAYQITSCMQVYQKDVKYMSETYSESFKDGKDTYSDNVELLGEYHIVIKITQEKETEEELKDW